jgi:hypothetical protein
MALDFPNSPTNGQVYTDPGSGEQWVYDAPTNSWTSKGLVNTSGGLVFKGSLDITAAPPTGISAGWQYSSSTTGTPNAGFTGITGTVNKGDVVMYTGSGWILQSHSVPDATAVVKGIDTQKWARTGTELSPATAGDSVFTSGVVKVGGTTAAPTTVIQADGKVGIGTNNPVAALEVVGNIELGTKGLSNATAFLDITSDTTYADYGFRLLRGGAADGNTQFISRGTGGLELNCFDGGYISFSTTNAERARVNGPGDYVLGGTLPASPNITLSAAGNINAKGAVARVYADNAAAKAAGLVDGDIYRKADGTLMIVFT